MHSKFVLKRSFHLKKTVIIRPLAFLSFQHFIGIIKVTESTARNYKCLNTTPVYLFTCLGLHAYISICLPVYLTTCLVVYLSTCLPVYLSTCLSVYVYLSVPVYLSTCLPVPVFFTCLPFFMSTCLAVYLSTIYRSSCLPV